MSKHIRSSVYTRRIYTYYGGGGSFFFSNGYLFHIVLYRKYILHTRTCDSHDDACNNTYISYFYFFLFHRYSRTSAFYNGGVGRLFSSAVVTVRARCGMCESDPMDCWETHATHNWTYSCRRRRRGRRDRVTPMNANARIIRIIFIEQVPAANGHPVKRLRETAAVVFGRICAHISQYHSITRTRKQCTL